MCSAQNGWKSIHVWPQRKRCRQRYGQDNGADVNGRGDVFGIVQAFHFDIASPEGEDKREHLEKDFTDVEHDDQCSPSIRFTRIHKILLYNLSGLWAKRKVELQKTSTSLKTL